MFDLIPFLSYVLVVTFTPGPNNIMSMVNATQFGYKKTLKFIFGIATGFFVIMFSSCYFNLYLFNLFPKVKMLMSILGASYMLYLAYIIMTAHNKKNTDNPRLNSYYAGIALQFVNFKVILYGITVTSNFIIPYYQSNFLLLLFSIILTMFAVASTSCWAFFGVFFERFLSKYQKPFNITMGLLLIYCAYSISGIKLLFA